GSSHCVAVAANTAAVCGCPAALASTALPLSSMKTSTPPPLKDAADPDALSKRYLIAALLPSTRRQVTGPSTSNAPIGAPVVPTACTKPPGFSPAGPLNARTSSRSDPGPAGVGNPLVAEPNTRSCGVPPAAEVAATLPPAAAASASAAAINL